MKSLQCDESPFNQLKRATRALGLKQYVATNLALELFFDRNRRKIEKIERLNRNKP